MLGGAADGRLRIHEGNGDEGGRGSCSAGRWRLFE